MKKIYLLFATLLGTVLLSASCGDDDKGPKTKDYAPGEIPGLGEAEGELTGTPFRLPDGVELTSEITGGGSQYGYWTQAASGAAPHILRQKDGSVTGRHPAAITRAGENCRYFGSGYGYVDLLIPMRNTRSGEITVTFPAATILRSHSGAYQHGVLIKRVTVTIPPGADCLLCLAFYCGNASKGAASGSTVYELGVVSDAKPLQDLCSRVKNKKINLEDHRPADSYDMYAYQAQVSELQDIVWAVTDGTGLDGQQIEYLNSLPGV